MAVDLQEVIDSINYGIITIDNEGKIVQSNPAANQIFSNKGQNLVGTDIRSNSKLKDIINILDRKDKKTYKVRMKLGDKKQKIYRMDIFPILQGKKLDGQTILIEDLTQEAVLMETLMDSFTANLKASEILNYSKNKKGSPQLKALRQLKSLISQKLQVPVSTISEYTGMILTGKARELPKQAQELLRSAYRGNELLIKTINNVLDTFDLESPDIVIKKQNNVDINKLIEQIISDFDEQVKAEGLKLIYKKSDIKLPLLNINSSMIDKVLKHLIDNAIKFTKKGSITILAKKEKNQITISIKDTGIGISAHEQKFLFQKFLKLNKTGAESEDLGLGLYICRMIVEKHNGQIWVESKKGKGSIFSFSLPC